MEEEPVGRLLHNPAKEDNRPAAPSSYGTVMRCAVAPRFGTGAA
jgi:hypothetical protein